MIIYNNPSVNIRNYPPGVIVDVLPPAISGVPGISTNTIFLVGTSQGGPINAPINVQDYADYQSKFGNALVEPFDMGSLIYLAQQRGSNNFICVRVTDGTDLKASASILDTTTPDPVVGMILTAINSGALYNTVKVTIGQGTNSTIANPLYKISIQLPNAYTEIYDNIGGSGSALWQNIVNAINNGQSQQDAPSTLVVAAINGGVDAINVTNSGINYTAIPTINLSGGAGSGATAVALMKALTATPVTAQSGGGSYAPGDTITLAETTASIHPILTVQNTKVVSASIADAGTGGTDGAQTVIGTTGTGTKFEAGVTISGGEITAVDSISVAGNYTANPVDLTQEPVTGAGLVGAKLNIKMGVLTANVTTPGSISALAAAPVSQSSTSGSGTGATFNMTYGVLAGQITAPGNNYTSAPTVLFSGGGGSGALASAAIGATASPPALQNYTLSGGTNGNSGVTSETLVGIDDASPTGMYATKDKGIGTMALVGCTDPNTFGAQALFGEQEGRLMVTSGPIGETVAQAIAALQGSGVSSAAIKALVGDWEYWFDAQNNQWRYSTQQGLVCSLYSILPPNQSGLNSKIDIDTTIITQRSQANRPYTSEEIMALSNAGIDVVAYNINLGSYFALQTGKNSAYPEYQYSQVGGWDTYSRLTPYLAFSLQNANVQFVGKLLTPDLERIAFGVNAGFLQRLVDQGWIGDVKGGKAFSVVVVADGNTLVLNIAIVMFDVISNVLINLQNGAYQISAPVQNTPSNRKTYNLI